MPNEAAGEAAQPARALHNFRSPIRGICVAVAHASSADRLGQGAASPLRAYPVEDSAIKGGVSNAGDTIPSSLVAEGLWYLFTAI
jgi:hypothetical protein